MAHYLVTAPLVLVKDAEGVTHYVYQGAVIDWVPAANAKELVKMEMLEKIDLEDYISPPPGPDDPTPEDQLPAVDLTKLKGDRPPQAASKEAWVDYAAANGIAKAEAEALSKNDIIGLFTAPQA